MANNISNGNNANNTNNATITNNANPGKQTTAKDSSKEEELEEMLYRLDQAHAQVSLPWQSGHHPLPQCCW